MSLKYGGMYVLIVHNVILRNRCAQQAKKYLDFNNPQQEREREREREGRRGGGVGRWREKAVAGRREQSRRRKSCPKENAGK